MAAGLQVVVAVSPRLLADALCRALARDGLQAVTDSLAPPDTVFEVAVVSSGQEACVRARHVVTIPDQVDGQIELAALRETLAGLVQRSGD